MLIDGGGTDTEVELIVGSVAALREKHSAVLTHISQERVVSSLGQLAESWRNSELPFQKIAQDIEEPFPFSMVWPGLRELLESLSPPYLWKLIDDDGVRGLSGYPVIGHIVAGNTPLLPWTTIIRALLVRSASLVKLSSRVGQDWTHLFLRSLRAVDPDLADCVTLLSWPGGTNESDLALCQSVDLLVAYGSDSTITSLRHLCPSHTPLVGYGHRVSFGLVPKGAKSDEALLGFANDIFAYDQGGCLSPQTIFVEGDWAAAKEFAMELAKTMEGSAWSYPIPPRPLHEAAVIQKVRSLAKMSSDNRTWSGNDHRWTVIARKASSFEASPSYCVISVQPLSALRALGESLAPVRGHLQGCAVATRRDTRTIPMDQVNHLSSLGVSRICRPGHMQSPPLSWRQDGRPVLRSLLSAKVLGV